MTAGLPVASTRAAVSHALKKLPEVQSSTAVFHSNLPPQCSAWSIRALVQLHIHGPPTGALLRGYALILASFAYSTEWRFLINCLSLLVECPHNS